MSGDFVILKQCVKIVEVKFLTRYVPFMHTQRSEPGRKQRLPSALLLNQMFNAQVVCSFDTV